MKFFKIAIALLFVLSAAVQTFAVTVTVTPPQMSGGVNQTDVDNASAILGTNISNQLNRVNDTKKFLEANANSISYSNHVATQRGYTDYDWFALTLGWMMGAQLPSSSYGDVRGLDGNIQDKGDVGTALTNQFAVQLGLKAWFISDDLYLGAKIGSFKYEVKPNSRNKFKYNAFLFGLTGNYMLFNKTSLGFGVIKWRGLNFGTGLIYQTTDNKYTMKVRDITPGTFNTTVVNVENPHLRFSMDSKIVTIPLELTTALRLLYCVNFTLGIGADFAMGKTDMSLSMDGDIKVNSGAINTPGRLNVRGGNDASPGFVKPKIMGGIGISIGDALVIDIPFTRYLGNGFDFGITLGTVW